MTEESLRAGLGPREVYSQRQQQRWDESRRLAGQERLIGNGKLLLFLIGLVVAWLAFALHRISGWWLVPPLAGFTFLLFRHEQVIRAWHRAGRAAAFYQRGLARLDNDWRGKGHPGASFLDESHPYAADLDLFGPGSLFELLCTARTRTGEATLASWLNATTSAEEIGARQQAVLELRPLLDLREELALLGDDVPVGVDFNVVARWGAEPALLGPSWPRWLALLIGLASLTFLAGWLTHFALGQETQFWGPTPFLISVLLGMALAGWLSRRVQHVLQAVEKRGRDLSLLARVLACLEKPTFQSPRLRQLQEQLSVVTCRLPVRNSTDNRQLTTDNCAAPLAADRPARQPPRSAQFAAQSDVWSLRLAVALGHSDGLRHREMASQDGPAHRRVAERGWRVRGSLRPGFLLL